MWDAVRSAWAEQHNQYIPSLIETKELEKIARDDPALICELGRWCDNPFVLLDHFSAPEIRNWMESKRQQYVIAQLTEVTRGIADQRIRTALSEWLVNMELLKPKQRQVSLREEGMWDLLHFHAPQAFNATMAPFLKRVYTTTCANVLVLDELYPDLTRHALRNSGYTDTNGATLIDAYCRVPELRQVFRVAQAPAVRGGKTWAPIEKYLNSLRQLNEADGHHQY